MCIRDRNQTEDLAADLQAEAQKLVSEEASLEGGKKSAPELAARLENLAEGLKEEKVRMARSRLDQLTRLEAEARRLRKEAEEKSKDVASNSSNEGQGQGQGMGAGQGGQLAQGESSESFEGSGLAGEGSQTAGGGGGGGIANFAQALSRDSDAELSRVANSLSDTAAELPDVIRALATVEQRILVLLDDLIKHDFAEVGEVKVPLEYKRAVEDYYRDLSDDFPEEDL